MHSGNYGRGNKPNGIGQKNQNTNSIKPSPQIGMTSTKPSAQYGGSSSTAQPPVSKQELSEAQKALMALKAKMSQAPKQPVNTYNQPNQNEMSNPSSYNKSSIVRKDQQKQMNSGYGAKNSQGMAYGGGGGFRGGNFAVDEEEGADEPTYPCPDCGRKFTNRALAKHAKICKKVFMKKRKAFNTQKQRIVDSDQPSLMRMGALEEKKIAKMKQQKGKPNWKLQSEEFRSICRGGYGTKTKGGMGKGGMGKGGMGGKMPQQQYKPSVINDGFTPCQYCNRKYNGEAYQKHLGGCKRRYEEAQIRNKISKPLSKPGRSGKK